MKARWACGSLAALALGLKDLLGFFQFAAARGGKALAGAIDEKLDHANARTDALGADAFAGHRLGDLAGAFGEDVPRGICRNRLNLRRPLPFRGHNNIIKIKRPGQQWEKSKERSMRTLDRKSVV